MKVIKWLNEYFEEAVMIVLLSVMTIVMGAQIVARYLFNCSISWTEELTRYLFVWSGFLSIGFAVRNSIAIRIDQFISAFSFKLKTFILCVDYVIEAIFFGYLIPQSCTSFFKVMESGRTSTAMGMPMWILQAAPMLGFILAEFRLLQQIWKKIKELKEGEECRE
ncbi:MAG: TRAP transporter small permease [Eubacteriales bacterium]|nr:TRAP transporter small permease [Eubacteriales bacterium]